MGNGFSVKPDYLQAGSEDMADLQEYCQIVVTQAVSALSSMAGAAGGPGLAGALTNAANQGNRSFTGMWAAYGHTSLSLAGSGTNYATTEQTNAGLIAALSPGTFIGGPRP